MITAATEKRTLIGRTRELKALLDASHSEKHILLLGETGAGKTALIEAFCRVIRKTSPHKPILTCRANTSFKDICLQFLVQLWSLGFLKKIPHSLTGAIPNDEKMQRCFSGLSVTVLKNLVLANVQGHDLICVFDNLPKLKLKFYLFLDNLRDHAQLIVIPENRTKKTAGRLWLLSWGFEEIEIGPLSLEESKQLASLRLQEENVAGDKELIKHLAQISGGNPKKLMKLCGQVQKQIAHHRGKSDAVLANVDIQIEDFLKMRDP